VVREPHKRPAMKIGILNEGSDILVVGVIRAVLIWRVPGLASASTASPGKAELLIAVPMPPRCNFVRATLGISLGPPSAFGWCAAELSGAGADTNGCLDVWHFDSARPLALPLFGAAPVAGNNDAVSEAFATVGVSIESMAATVRSLVSANAEKDLRAWIGALSNVAVDKLYAVTDEAEASLAGVARDLRRWLRSQQDKKGAAAERRAEDARMVLHSAEEVRRRVVWKLQAAFAASDHEGDEADAEEAITGSAPAADARAREQTALQAAAAMRRQRYLQQRERAGLAAGQ